MFAQKKAPSGVWALRLEERNAAALHGILVKGKLSAKQLSNGLIKAASLGWEGGVDLLLPLADPKRQSSRALVESVNYPSILAKLLPVSDAQSNKSYAIRLALWHANPLSLDMLIPYSSPQDMALGVASVFSNKRPHDSTLPERGREENYLATRKYCMQLLLPVVSLTDVLAPLVAKRSFSMEDLDLFVEESIVSGIPVNIGPEGAEPFVAQHLPRTHRAWMAHALSAATHSRPGVSALSRL